MRAKAYVLLDIVDGNCDRVAQMLRSKRGVLMADSLEGPPDGPDPCRHGAAEAAGDDGL